MPFSGIKDELEQFGKKTARCGGINGCNANSTSKIVKKQNACLRIYNVLIAISRMELNIYRLAKVLHASTMSVGVS